ncbi:YybH family protein [Singulisphaera rosea]
MRASRIGWRFGAGLIAAAFAVLVAIAESERSVAARDGGPQATSTKDETNAIRSLIAKYAKSIDDADTTLAAEIWSTSPDVSFIHPLGHERGWEEVKRNFYEKTMAGMFTDRKLTPKDATVHAYGDAAWAEFTWKFSAKLKQGGQPLKTNGREIQIYHKVSGHWELIHVHYSNMPMTGRGQGF